MKVEIKKRQFSSPTQRSNVRIELISSPVIIVDTSLRIKRYFTTPLSGKPHVLKNIETEGKIKGFSGLPQNWDSYGADPISERAIWTALKIANHLSLPSNLPEGIMVNVFPMRDGGIQFEFDREDFCAELEISSEGEMEFFLFDENGEIIDHQKLEIYEMSQLSSLLESSPYAA